MELIIYLFSLNIQGWDDVGAVDVKMFCPNTGSNHEVKQWGKMMGGKSIRRVCMTYFAKICGIQTWVESNKGSGDHTGVNDIKLVCCSY